MNNISKKTRSLSKLAYPAYLLALLVLIAFLTAGRFLPVSDSPGQAAAIIVLSGSGGRVEKAAELYFAGCSPYLVLSNSKGYGSKSGNMLQTALALGIPQAAIITEDKALSTYDNAQLTLPIMKRHGFSSAIVVSSDFHMRRVKFIFESVYKRSGIDLIYVGSPSGYHANRWWSSPFNREITITEYAKMIGNFFGYNGPEAKKSLDWIKGWFR